MPNTPEPHEVERLLRQIPLAEAPEELWDDIRAELRQPERVRPLGVARRPVRSPLLAIAAVRRSERRQSLKRPVIHGLPSVDLEGR